MSMKHGISALAAPLGDAAPLLARLLFAYLFVCEGWGKINGYADTQSYMAQFGIEPRLLPLVIALEFGGGLALALGGATRPLALALGIFSLLAALIFHQGADYSEVLEFRKDSPSLAGCSLWRRWAAARGRSTPCSRIVSGRRWRAVELTALPAEGARFDLEDCGDDAVGRAVVRRMADARQHRQRRSGNVARAAGGMDLRVDDAVAVAGDDRRRDADRRIARRQRRDMRFGGDDVLGVGAEVTWSEHQRQARRDDVVLWRRIGGEDSRTPPRIEARPAGRTNRRRNAGPKAREAASR